MADQITIPSDPAAAELHRKVYDERRRVERLLKDPAVKEKTEWQAHVGNLLKGFADLLEAIEFADLLEAIERG